MDATRACTRSPKSLRVLKSGRALLRPPITFDLSSLYKATPTAPVCSHAPVFAPALGPTPDKIAHCATCTDPGGLHVASIAMLVVGVVAPQLWNTRKVASKLTTSSCSNAAVGEKVARRRIEPTTPHRRHGQRGRARSTAWAARETYIISIYLSSIYHLSIYLAA